MDRLVGSSARRVLLVALALSALLLASAGAASASAGSGYSVTFVARSCPAYTDIFANRSRNDILESLKDLGPNAQYSDNFLVNPDAENLPPQTNCTPLAGWRFKLGTGYQSRAVSGPWGALSIVTNPFDTWIQTRESTRLLNQNGQQIGNQRIAGATTVELTDAERDQASNPDQLWAQGGTPTDPVLDTPFPGPEYGFGALRCATDDLNGDNVEYIFFPAGVTHVFCYGLYVRPSPTAGLITIEKQVSGAPAGDSPSFPFNGSISYDPNGFQLANGGSMDFYRAGGATWDVTEGSVPNYELTSVRCTATTADGAPGMSTAQVSDSTTSIGLVAGEHVTCVYSNRYVPPTGGLTISKVTRGGVGSFQYVVSPSSGDGPSHQLRATTTTPGVAVDAEPSPLALPPGAYTIHEQLPASPDGHWRLVSVHCGGATDSATHPVDVEISTGEPTACTFVNSFTPSGSISISKFTVGGTGTAAFLVIPTRGAAAQFLQHATTTADGVPVEATPATDADATDHLRLGPYTIVEQSPPSPEPDNWALASVRCNGIDEPFAQGAVQVRLTRAQPSVRCTFGDAFNPTPPPVPPPIVTPEPPIPPSPPHPNVVPPIYALSDLVVTKRASSPVVVLGNAVSYRITVKNLGPDPAQRVTLSDQPFGRAKVLSVHNPAGGCQISPQVVCQLQTVKPGATVVLTVKLVPLASTARFINRAVAGTATNERTLANNTASATVRVVVPPSPPPPGLG